MFKFATGQKIMCEGEEYTVCTYNTDIDLRVSATKKTNGSLWWLDPIDCKIISE